MAKNQIDMVMSALTEVTEKVIKKITLDTHANLIAATPVDLGWARANWIPAIGTPVTSPTGTPGGYSQSAQLAGIASVATSYTLPRGKVFISNNVKYITKLNEGSSRQAPAGFVQNAISKAVTIDLKSLSS